MNPYVQCRHRVSHKEKLREDPDYDKRRQKEYRESKREN